MVLVPSVDRIGPLGPRLVCFQSVDLYLEPSRVKKPHVFLEFLKKAIGKRIHCSYTLNQSLVFYIRKGPFTLTCKQLNVSKTHKNLFTLNPWVTSNNSIFMQIIMHCPIKRAISIVLIRCLLMVNCPRIVFFIVAKET